jgi:hypothetical protein
MRLRCFDLQTSFSNKDSFSKIINKKTSRDIQVTLVYDELIKNRKRYEWRSNALNVEDGLEPIEAW